MLFHRLAIAGVVLAGGLTAFSVVDRGRRPIERTWPSFESSRKPIVLAGPPEIIREAERGRRAQRPTDPKREQLRRGYDAVWEGPNSHGTPPRPKPAEPRPPTSCRSVEPAPKHTDNLSGPHRVHDNTVSWFENASGFGATRMAAFYNDRGILVPSRAIDRVELVSLLTDYDPSVYVLDEIATPPLARQAERRPLDEFERLGLDAVRRGEEVVWTREAPTRMFGAIRAGASCLQCHVNAREGDLLGAFTYYLNTPVDRLAGRGPE